MKKILLILFLSLVSIGFAQKIERHKSFFKYEFIQNDVPMSFGGVVRALENNPEAYQLAKSARNLYITSEYIGFAGGFAIGWGITTEEKTNWKLIGIGAGLIAVSIPFEMISDKKIKKALSIYNSGLNETLRYYFKPQYHLIFNDKGLGIAMRF